MKKITIDYSYIFPFINENEINSFTVKGIEALNSLLNKTGKGNDFLGWLNLPDFLLNDKNLNDIIDTAREIKDNADILICIGIGGSYLGAKAVCDALLNPLHNNLDIKQRNLPKIFFVGQNISARWLESILAEIDNSKSVYVNVISKSGTTTEPGIAFRIIKQKIEEKYGKKESSKRIIATTDAKRGALKELSNKEKYRTFVIPDDVGGRYSVLTAVGLLPIASTGINIKEILKGAQSASVFGKNKDINSNPSLLYAIIRNILLKKGYNIEILVNYESTLHYFSEWWKQLFGESEGKEGKGIFPASVDFTTDLHSMGQWIQEGQRIIFETVLNIEHPLSLVKIPADKDNLDGFNFISGSTYDDVNKKAFKGTLLAHYEGKVPNIIFNIPELTPFYLGQLIYIFELACGISGYILNVNPFDQPGVEAYKNNMFALLKKPGETHAKNLASLEEKIKLLPKGKITE